MRHIVDMIYPKKGSLSLRQGLALVTRGEGNGVHVVSENSVRQSAMELPVRMCVNKRNAFVQAVALQDRNTCKTEASWANEVGPELRVSRIWTSRVECEPTCSRDTNSAAGSHAGLGHSSKRKHLSVVAISISLAYSTTQQTGGTDNVITYTDIDVSPLNIEGSSSSA